MSEILDFVTYHIKQVGLDTRLLNGGIILTGGGSQLKHLIQLTEYTTGLNARIGLPNEHLAPNHIDELKKPMYATCLGLILKGYADYDMKHKEFTESFKRVEVPRALKAVTPTPVAAPVVGEVAPEPTPAPVNNGKKRVEFWEKFKNNLIDLFKEEDELLNKQN
jgi:cell division protein FtsA